MDLAVAKVKEAGCAWVTATGEGIFSLLPGSGNILQDQTTMALLHTTP